MQSLLFDIASYGRWAVWGTATFAIVGLYAFFVGMAWWLTKVLFPALGLGQITDARPLRPGQIAKEIRRSCLSIVIFGLYGVLTVELFRAGIVDVAWEAPFAVVALDVVLLFLWNEIHFFASHRLLHTPWLYRHVHRIHHESVVPTPFSVYSFHWAEALLLGSVMITAMLIRTFSIWALLSLPVFSLLLNLVGHWNYNVFAGTPRRSASVEHGKHHRFVGGNYGFYLTFCDRIFKTRLRESA